MPTVDRTPLLAFFLLFFSATNAFAKSDKVRVIWQEDPARQATIGWDQTSGDNATVSYGILCRGTVTYHLAAVSREEDYLGMRNRRQAVWLERSEELICV